MRDWQVPVFPIRKRPGHLSDAGALRSLNQNIHNLVRIGGRTGSKPIRNGISDDCT